MNDSYAKPNEANTLRLIKPANKSLTYMGRVDWKADQCPLWVFPYTQVRFRFTGKYLGVRLINARQYGTSCLGAFIDGFEYRIDLVHCPSQRNVPVADQDFVWPNSAVSPYSVEVTIADNLPDIEHEAVIFKRQDGQHYLKLTGIMLEQSAKLYPDKEQPPKRRMEVFGDSIACGERNEASLYAGREDPSADLSSYSNAWYSFAAIAARSLGAQLHDVSQGGAALLDGIGWFQAPQSIGMESIWNKIEYNSFIGPCKPWDFSQYQPQVVIVALGQNDAYPRDFMAQDYSGSQAEHWRRSYAKFLRTLLETYPQAQIITATSVLAHDEHWDQAIEDVCRELDRSCIHHLVYRRNGIATSGHPRISEQKEMADELVAFIQGLGSRIW